MTGLGQEGSDSVGSERKAAVKPAELEVEHFCHGAVNEQASDDDEREVFHRDASQEMG